MDIYLSKKKILDPVYKSFINFSQKVIKTNRKHKSIEFYIMNKKNKINKIKYYLIIIILLA